MDRIPDEDQISPEYLLGIVLSLLVFNFAIILHDYLSFFRRLLQSFLCFLTPAGQAGCARTTGQCCNTNTYNVANLEPPKKNKRFEGLDISTKDVGIAMDKLGIFHSHPDGEATARLGSEDIIGMFEVDEPSLEEIKEAFDVFDENMDGFIDANELSKVIKALGYGKFSEFECKWLIRPFDENGDGLIDFKEFTKLVEKSLS